ERRDLACRDARRERRTAPASEQRAAAGERGEHRHVQPRDRYEVRDARATEHCPLRLRDGTLIPDGERSDHARVTGSWQCTRDTHPYPLSRALDMVAGAPRDRVHPDVGPRIADIAGGTKVSFEQPRLEIESGRIDTAVRPFQPHGQSPAFAGVNDRRRRSVAPSADKKRIAIARREPRKRDPSRNDGARRIDMLDRERKPHSL